MSRYLFAISIGPVQGFIVAARRTRDFWMGSTILSECAKAIARWAAQVNDSSPDTQRLIFPGLDPDRAPQQLEPWDFDDAGKMPDQEFNVANVLLIDVDTQDPQGFATEAKQRLVDRWTEIVERTLDRTPEDATGPTPSVREDLDHACLQIQLERPADFFEFFAAWVPLEEGNYQAARRDVMRLLGARKACRNFDAWPGRRLKPKSSLDAARESVLKPPEQRKLALHIRESEQLDLAGVVKRLDFGNDAIRFPSVSRFAADPWIRGVLKGSNQAGLERIRAACRELQKLQLLRRRYNAPGRAQQDDLLKHSWWQDFPYEGSPLFVNRHADLLREHPYFCSEADRNRKPAAYARWKAKETELRRHLGEIEASIDSMKKEHGQPDPYFAILSADGDGMGKTLSSLAEMNDPAVHRAFSLAQTMFADRARQLVNSPWLPKTRGGDDPFHGAMVFAGADDILAFAPLDQCVELAAELHRLFEESLTSFLKGSGYEAAVQHLIQTGSFPTLRVGIAIGHFMEPLEDLLEYAQEANRRAKTPTEEEENGFLKQGKGNALAILVHSRGGAPFAVRDNWRDKDSEPMGLDWRILLWADMHRRRQLPAKAAYDLRQVAGQYQSKWTDSKQQAAALQRDAIRVFARKRPTDAHGKKDENHRQDRLKRLLASIETAADLLAVSQELLIGQRIGDALKQSRHPLLEDRKN